MDLKRIAKFIGFKLVEVAILIAVPWAVGWATTTLFPRYIAYMEFPQNLWGCGSLQIIMCIGIIAMMLACIIAAWGLVKLNWKWAGRGRC